MNASAAASPPHSQKDPPKQGGGLGEMPAPEIGGEAADDFLFTDDTFSSLPDFPCLSSPSTSTFSSSSSSNSSCAFPPSAAGGCAGDAAAAEPAEPATSVDGFDPLGDIDQLLDFASLSVPWDSEPLFPDVGMMIEDDVSDVPQPPPAGDDVSMAEAGGGEEGEACMAAAGDDLPRFFMEWLTSNRDSISAEDLRSIRLRRSTIEAAAARLGGGRQGTMQLLKLILTWVQNHHLHKKHPRGAMEEPAGHGHSQGQLDSPGANPGVEFAAGGQEMSSGTTSWMPYPAFMPPCYGGEAVYPGPGPYAFHPSCSTSSVVVNSQPFSPPPAADMHAASGGNMAWAQQYTPFPGGGAAGSYPMPPVAPQQFAAGYAAQYSSGHPLCSQRVAGMEASATKEARKKRMARQRRLSCLQQQRSQQLSLSQTQSVAHPPDSSPPAAHSAPVTLSGCQSWSFWPSASQVPHLHSRSSSSKSKQQAKSASGTPQQQKQDESPPRSTASDKRQGAKADKNLRFLLQKVLKQSDVGSLGRIVLPKKEAEIHLPELETRDGISIPMEDIGTSRVWNMRYRFWPNNKSRMYLLENTGDFVRSNELQEGDFIVIYSDVKSGKYLIRGVKVRQVHEQSNTAAAAGGKMHHKHGLSEKGGVPDVKAGAAEDCTVDASKADVCKGKSPHNTRRSRQEAAMNQMAVSI